MGFQENNRLTRRDFLRLFGVVLVAAPIAAEEIIAAPFGSLSRRFRVVLDACSMALFRPDICPPELLTARIKFEAAVFYALSRGWPLTAITLNHFLYGDGLPLDITSQFLSSVTKNGQPANIFLDSAYTNRLKDTAKTHITGNRYDSTFITRVPDPDMEHSFNRCTVNISGQISSRTKTGSEITLTGAAFSLNDYYDWNPTPVPVGEKVQILGREFKLTDREGALLQNSPLAKKYSLSTKPIPVNDPYPVYL